MSVLLLNAFLQLGHILAASVEDPGDESNVKEAGIKFFNLARSWLVQMHAMGTCRVDSRERMRRICGPTDCLLLWRGLLCWRSVGS